MMKVFITGISGLLGRHVARVCLSKGYEVIGLVRNINTLHLEHHPNLKIVKGDLSDTLFLEKHLLAIDILIHAASDTSMSIVHEKKIFETNLKGVENLVNACENSTQLKTFIYISSANTLQSGTLSQPNTDAIPITDIKNQLPYVRSKLAAEHFLKQRAKSHQFPIIIFNPTFILGSEDYKPSSGKLLKTIIDQQLKFYTSGSKNVIDVRNTAKAIVQSIETGKIGEQYILCNEQNISFRLLFEITAKYAGVTPPKYLIPNNVAFLIGYLGTFFERLTRKSIQLNHQTIRFATSTFHYSAEKAIRDLNFQNRPLEETIEDTVLWLKGNP